MTGRYVGRMESSGDGVVLRVVGDLDLYAAPALKLDLLAAIERSGGDVVIDLTGVGFLDSTGLGVLVGALRRLNEAERKLALIVTAPAVLRVFTVTGLDRVFTIRATGTPGEPEAATGRR